MDKDRTITITTNKHGVIITTRIHVDMGTIYISKENRYIFNGEITEFKRIVAATPGIDSDLKRVYGEILDLAEFMIDTMAKA